MLSTIGSSSYSFDNFRSERSDSINQEQLKAAEENTKKEKIKEKERPQENNINNINNANNENNQKDQISIGQYQAPSANLYSNPLSVIEASYDNKENSKDVLDAATSGVQAETLFTAATATYQNVSDRVSEGSKNTNTTSKDNINEIA